MGIYYILQIKEAHKRPYWRETISGKLQCDGGGGGGGVGVEGTGGGGMGERSTEGLTLFLVSLFGSSHLFLLFLFQNITQN